METVVATAAITLVAVLIGALASTGSQLYLDKKREQREADRAKQLVAGELLQAQVMLRNLSKNKPWPPMEDADTYLPTSAWHEHRSRLAGKLNENLWNQLVVAYTLLELDRARFVGAQLPRNALVTAEEAEALYKAAAEVGKLRRQLGGGGWKDELSEDFKPRPEK